MYYILNENIALRSWIKVPYAYYIKNVQLANPLTREEFLLLLDCDAKHDIESSELTETLIRKALISPCEYGERELSDWQKYRHYDNRYMHSINWMITERCNCNCLHCFNAADNSMSTDEWSFAEALKFLDEAANCGINAFTLTGGEPVLHRNFCDILDAIYERNMHVFELNTNGLLLTEEILDKMISLNCFPLMKISFDGIGFHDWLRNKKGCEEKTLEAIKLCIKKGFIVKAQTNIHKKNVHTLMETALLLDSIGVNEMRIIRTSESPRWEANAGDACLPLEEYFDKTIEFMGQYIKTDCKMNIDIWNLMHSTTNNKTYYLRAIQFSKAEYRDSIPICKGNRGMAAVAANGNIYPCHQVSGSYDAYGWNVENVKDINLKTLLTSSEYLDEICTDLKTLKENNPICASCKYFVHCAGGCRALSVAITKTKLGVDYSKCIFFQKNYYKKIIDTMGNYRNLTVLEV